MKLNDPKAFHTYKAITVRVNKYEADLFARAADSASRDKIDWMRRTLVKAAEGKLVAPLPPKTKWETIKELIGLSRC
jgi:hypothetical protein